MTVTTLKDKILKLDKRVPRYTSYPTAPHFQSTEQDKEYKEWLSELTGEQSVSLYVHIPFCAEMCWYCGCHTKVTKKYEPIAEYVSFLLKEIDLVAHSLTSKLSVGYLHFGGGSPGMLSAEDFTAIMTRFKETFEFTPKSEVGIELDPRGVTAEKIKAYADSGVTRASLGVQDFDQKVMCAINREQPFSLTEKTVALLKAEGIHEINFDLIYGLPHQTEKTIAETINQAITLAPSRFSFFGYAHVPWMKKHMRLIQEETLPDTEMRYDLFHFGADKLKSAGYEPIGIDHFALADDPLVQASKTGRLRRNFQGYTTDPSANLIGFGVSAIGLLDQGYHQNSPDMPVYKKRLSENSLPVVRICRFAGEDVMRAEIIEALMCHFSVDLARISQKYERNVSDFSVEMSLLAPYEAMGLLTISQNSVITIQPGAYEAVRLVASAFDTYLRQQAPDVVKHSKAI